MLKAGTVIQADRDWYRGFLRHRAQELQERSSVRLIQNARVNRNDARRASVLERGDDASLLGVYFASHPPLRDRIRLIRAMTRQD